MRRWLPLCAVSALATGCVDYDKLQKDFCATADVKLCDDFESAGVSGTWNQIVEGGGVIAVVKPTDNDNPAKALRGKQVIKFDVPAGGRAMLEDGAVTSTVGQSGDLYVRAYIYFENASAAGSMDLFTVRDATSAPIVSFAYENAQAKLTTTGGREAGNSLALSGDHWFCFELALLHDSGSSPALPRAELYLDDNPNDPGPPFIQLGGLTAPSLDFSSTRVGVDRTSVVTAVGNTVAMDEVIIDSKRITCKK